MSSDLNYSLFIDLINRISNDGGSSYAKDQHLSGLKSILPLITDSGSGVNPGEQNNWTAKQVFDSSTNKFGNDLSSINGVGHDAGRSAGGGGLFVAVNKTSLTIPSNERLQGGNSNLSISAWVKFNSLTGLPQVIACKDDDTTQLGSEYYLGHYPPYNGFVWQVQVFGNNSPFVALAIVPVTVATGTWYHLVGTWNYSTGVIKLTVNALTPVMQTVTGFAPINTTNYPFTIGSCGNLGGYVDGVIDSVGVWKKELSSGEVTALTLSGGNAAEFSDLPTGMQTDAALVGWWDLSESTGNRLDARRMNSQVVIDPTNGSKLLAYGNDVDESYRLLVNNTGISTSLDVTLRSLAGVATNMMTVEVNGKLGVQPLLTTTVNTWTGGAQTWKNGTTLMADLNNTARSTFRMFGKTVGSASIIGLYDGPDSANAGYCSFGIDTSANGFGVSGVVFSSGKNGTGTIQPIHIGTYNGTSWVDWISITTAGAVIIPLGLTVSNLIAITGIKVEGATANSVASVFSYDGPDTANAAYFGFGLDNSGGTFGQSGAVISCSKNGTGTIKPLHIGSYNGASWIDWISITTAGVVSTPTNTFKTASGVTTFAPFNLGAGVSAVLAAPNNGDIWLEGNVPKIRIGGVTKTITIT